MTLVVFGLCEIILLLFANKKYLLFLKTAIVMFRNAVLKIPCFVKKHLGNILKRIVFS